MRFLVAMVLCGCCTVGYSDEPVESTEVTATEETSNEEVAAAPGVESKKDKPVNGGCGCGNKPKF